MSGQPGTILQLADTVYASDGYQGRANAGEIAHILEVALKTRLGLLCLGSAGHEPVRMNLGNGYDMLFTVEASL